MDNNAIVVVISGKHAAVHHTAEQLLESGCLDYLGMAQAQHEEQHILTIFARAIPGNQSA